MSDRPITLFTGQWADMKLAALAEKAAGWGYDGLELACWGDHFDVVRATEEDGYADGQRDILAAHGLSVHAISHHLVGQAVCDPIDERHHTILPDHVWGNGKPDGVRERAAEDMKRAAHAARALGVSVVNGFTGSPIWAAAYAFPPHPPGFIEAGFREFADRWNPILDAFDEADVKFALEVHPTEIAFDTASTRRALAAIDNHKHFGINFDPSHLGYQRVDYVGFLRAFGDKIFNVHMKDVWWTETGAEAGVFGGHANFGTDGRSWDFRSLGHGSIDFGAIIRQLNFANYQGPLTVEWEDPGMAREAGAEEACAFVRQVEIPPAAAAFDAAFEN